MKKLDTLAKATIVATVTAVLPTVILIMAKFTGVYVPFSAHIVLFAFWCSGTIGMIAAALTYILRPHLSGATGHSYDETQ